MDFIIGKLQGAADAIEAHPERIDVKGVVALLRDTAAALEEINRKGNYGLDQRTP